MGKNARLKRERKAQRTSQRPVGEESREAPSVSASRQAIETSRLGAWLRSPFLHTSLILLLCIATAIFPIESEDIFSNIVTGKLLWTERSIPTMDPFSFTGPYRWFLNRPLPSLIFFGVHTLGGLPAIQVFCALVFGLTYVIVYYTWLRRTAMPLVVFAVTTLAICASCYWFQTRIYVFAYLFTAIALSLITSARPRVMAWAIPLQILWINSHPSAILGTFLVGFWWCVTLWRVKKIDLFSSVILVGVLISNVLCPVGIQSYLKFADEVFGSHPSRSNIYEWFSPFHTYVSSQHLAWWFYGAIVLLVVVLGYQFLHAGRVRWAIPLIPVTLGLFALSIGSARHIPLFYLSFVGVLVGTAESLWNGLSPTRRSRFTRFQTRTGVALVGVSLLTSIKVIFLGYSNGDAERHFAVGIDIRKFPERATQMLLDANVEGNIFSDYGAGSYFLYRMYPRYKVYIDSARLDEVYGEEGYRHYMVLGNDSQVAAQDIKKYDIRSFLLPLPTSASDIVELYRFLSSHPTWRLAYFDDGYMIFITEAESLARNIPTYRALSPFMDMAKVLKERPETAVDLVRDFELGDRLNPDSSAYLALKAFFYKAQSRTSDFEVTISYLAAVCQRRVPAPGCQSTVVQRLIRRRP